MLKKIEFRYIGGEQIDISDYKIYWDTQKNQFRHKFNCCECGESLGCRCYDTLDQAIEGVDDGLICDNCGISEALSEMSVDELLSDVDEYRQYKVDEYASSLVTENMRTEYIQETECKDVGRDEIWEMIEDGDEYDKVKEFVIQNILTSEEKRDIWINSCDGYALGDACGI